jgi:hypothetical protein
MSNKTVEQLVTEMNNPPVTLEQLQKLEADKTPAGRAAYLAAAAQFTEHSGSSADKLLEALKREDATQSVTVAATIAQQSKKLDDIEQTLEGTLRHVRAANAALRAATRRPWWMRFLCC